MCRIKFQGESLGTFLLYEVVMDAIIVDLGVIGSPEPVRIVTANVDQFFGQLSRMQLGLDGSIVWTRKKNFVQTIDITLKQ